MLVTPVSRTAIAIGKITSMSIFAVISAYSKSVKEATSKSTFIMITASICGMAPMLALDLGSISSYIPLLNSAMRLYDIFLLDYSLTNILITCGSNLVITIALAWVLSIMFNSERIMFNK